MCRSDSTTAARAPSAVDRVLVSQSRCRAGITGIDVAVHISADLGANPFAVGVVHPSHGRDVELVDQVSVGGSLGGVGLRVGQPIQPLTGHIRGCVATAVGFQYVQREHGVIDVVVTSGGDNIASGRRCPARAKLEPLRHRVERGYVVIQRPRLGDLEVFADVLDRPVVTKLDRLAQIATGTSPGPGSEQLIGQDRRLRRYGWRRGRQAVHNGRKVVGFDVRPIGPPERRCQRGVERGDPLRIEGSR